MDKVNKIKEICDKIVQANTNYNVAMSNGMNVANTKSALSNLLWNYKDEIVAVLGGYGETMKRLKQNEEIIKLLETQLNEKTSSGEENVKARKQK